MKKTLLSLSLVVFFFFLMPRKIDINVSDLGRHLKNGEIFITQGKIIESNYYSYTEPYIPVVNHHWLSGGIFFIVYRHFGFIGLSVFFCLIMAFAVYLMFLVAQRRTNSLISLTLVLFSIIFILSRLEIRPEGFSFLFLAVFIYLLDFFTASKKNFRIIFFVLLVLQMLWVNLHIFFILGPLITGAYFFGAVLDHDWIYAKKLGTLLFFLPLGSLANPWGFSGLLEPINIFVGYDIPVIENRSIFNAVLLNPGSKIVTDFLTYFLLLFIFAVFSPLFFKKSYQKKNTYIWLFLFFVFWLVTAKVMRFVSFFGLYLVYFSALLFTFYMPLPTVFYRVFKYITPLAMGVIFLFSLLNPNYGFGLQNNSQDAESFFKRKNLQGPILNSYENGSYIIFYLFPTEKVFVDGRPEAYSVEFQRDAALKVFEDENTFKHLDNMYGFNTIILPTSALDERYKNFIFRRLAGNQWTGVLLDQHSVILVRTDSQNNAFQFNNKVSALEDKLNITKRSERKNVPNFWLYLINFFS